MAVSHVWSHGQGGRPEIFGNALLSPTPDSYTGGFNLCLHRRFERVSRNLGCVSYWMDTPCIPHDHKLRLDEISHINDVFLGSKVTLVCDRDIMSLDLSNPTLQTMESILATVLVCDWNVRAWTFLEAMRATNIYLLGRDDTTVRLQDMLVAVWSAGDISLSNLFFTTPHLIPAPNYYRATTGWEGSKTLETLPVDKAAAVLNNRHASRAGDDIVIWSLLCQEAPSHTAQDFWPSLQTRKLPVEVSTAFLLSETSRLKSSSGVSIPGLSWAPECPNLAGQQKDHDMGDFLTVNEENCVKGIVTEKGLLAEWRISQFPVANVSTPGASSSAGTPSEPGTTRYLEQIAFQSLIPKGYKWGAIIQPAQDARYHLDLGQLPLPAAGKGQPRFGKMKKMKDKENTRSTAAKEEQEEEVLVAILGTRDLIVQGLHRPRMKLGANPGAPRWTWAAVHRWKTNEASLPVMRRERICIA
ncbi:hypothetical protein QBC37DRAFT_432404 [Rhypophila decipiens]|uniref:Heterokaryon incompatibility domain-containing protein n=1 Tax=Rhypophila decipiens TaxID=261697 RepID=A0AAN7B4S4_9PEZI|nr:hypothetical protein QBC37DRAFT_432404 [Rhypophila decipiens]